MTSEQRLDRDLPGILGAIAAGPYPDYIDSVLATTAQRRQRPAWTFPERWLPMDVATRPVPTPTFPWRGLGVLALIGLLIAGALAVLAGSQPRLPDPFGVARNGQVIYADDGSLFTRASPTDAARPLVPGGLADHEPIVAPDGSRFAFIRTKGGQDLLMASSIDGAVVARLHATPLHNATLAWSPDSTVIALINEERGVPGLFLVHADGSPATAVDLGGFHPSGVAWRPPHGRELLIRGVGSDGLVNLFLLPVGGGTPRPLVAGAPPGSFGWGQLDGATWSPDGKAIAMTVLRSTPDGTDLRAAVMDADGTDQSMLSDALPSTVQEGWPAYSPDGSMIAVHRWRWGGDGWLAVYDRTPSGWDGRDVGPVIAANGGNVDLIRTWSPDGSRIMARTSNTEQLFTIDPVTGTYDTLGWHSSSLPTWQRLAH